VQRAGFSREAIGARHPETRFPSIWTPRIMPWVALVETDTQLARIIGVSRQAVAKAERRGLLVRTAAGRWDVLAALAATGAM
jgi:hypothetical protein